MGLMPSQKRLRFDGWIAAIGTTSGTRIVVGRWRRTPFGAFTNVIIEAPTGHRRLIAPRQDVAAFLTNTERVDTVEITRVGVTAKPREWAVSAGPLHVAFELGRRAPRGWLLCAIPPPIARRACHGARDLHPITASVAWLDGTDLGGLAELVPRVRFGLGPVPTSPALVRVTTSVEVPR